jgi:hypothetical protein
MSRKAVKISLAEFETQVIAWANQLTTTGEDGEVTFDDPHKEAKLEASYGRMYVVDKYVHNGLMECAERENKILKDLSKVQFDWENCGCEPYKDDPCGFWMTSTGIPVLGCYAGGDWEDPVYFVLYPETPTTIRAYMPKDGNTWNLKNKTAWGSGEEDEEDPDENPRQVDVDAFRADVEKRIRP